MQCGSTKNKTCKSTLISDFDKPSDLADKRDSEVMLYFDINKAFDTIPRDMFRRLALTTWITEWRVQL